MGKSRRGLGFLEQLSSRQKLYRQIKLVHFQKLDFSLKSAEYRIPFGERELRKSKENEKAEAAKN